MNVRILSLFGCASFLFVWHIYLVDRLNSDNNNCVLHINRTRFVWDTCFRSRPLAFIGQIYHNGEKRSRRQTAFVVLFVRPSLVIFLVARSTRNRLPCIISFPFAALREWMIIDASLNGLSGELVQVCLRHSDVQNRWGRASCGRPGNAPKAAAANPENGVKGNAFK